MWRRRERLGFLRLHVLSARRARRTPTEPYREKAGESQGPPRPPPRRPSRWGAGLRRRAPGGLVPVRADRKSAHRPARQPARPDLGRLAHHLFCHGQNPPQARRRAARVAGRRGSGRSARRWVAGRVSGGGSRSRRPRDSRQVRPTQSLEPRAKPHHSRGQVGATGSLGPAHGRQAGLRGHSGRRWACASLGRPPGPAAGQLRDGRDVREGGLPSGRRAKSSGRDAGDHAAPGRGGMSFSDDEVERYARHLVLREIGGPGQQRLKGARVLIVGAGGLGAPAALYLAAAGVGEIAIVDPDTVALSNLQRQVLYETGDAGASKVARAAARVATLNPNVEVDPVAERLTASNARALIAGHDFVLDGTDDFATRFAVNVA